MGLTRHPAKTKEIFIDIFLFLIVYKMIWLYKDRISFCWFDLLIPIKMDILNL